MHYVYRLNQPYHAITPNLFAELEEWSVKLSPSSMLAIPSLHRFSVKLCRNSQVCMYVCLWVLMQYTYKMRIQHRPNILAIFYLALGQQNEMRSIY